MSDHHPEATVALELSDGLAVLRLNRPKAYNALDLRMGEELLDALVVCDENTRDVLGKDPSGRG